MRSADVGGWKPLGCLEDACRCCVNEMETWDLKLKWDPERVASERKVRMEDISANC